MKWYISLLKRVILTKTRRTSFISPTGSIKRANLNVQSNVIKDLATHLGLPLKHLFDLKDVLNIAKKVIGLQITNNRSMMTEKSVLATGFQSGKTDQVISVISKSR